MGQQQSLEGDELEPEQCQNQMSLDQFAILRNIGRGSFGKVCIVQKLDNKKLFAMKYINKEKCARQGATRNVAKEVSLLMELDHPFLVNIWFAFHDDEYYFQVFDLLMGGDLRYRLNQENAIDPEQALLYGYEIALALDYLQAHRVLHRDVKPENILLDDQGHAHLTDFNIATILDVDAYATSESGTKTYMAPELLGVALKQSIGYSFPIDWWSLGITLYELVVGHRPYPIRSTSTGKAAYEVITTSMVPIPLNFNPELTAVVAGMLVIRPEERVSSIASLQPLINKEVSFQDILRGRVEPQFTPCTDRLNCDPTYELEEMLIESDPLHKHKKRTDKRSVSAEEKACLMPIYNREQLMKDEEERIKKLEEELGIRPDEDAIAKRLGRMDD